MRQAQKSASIAQKEAQALRQRAQSAESALAGCRRTIESLHRRNSELEGQLATMLAQEKYLQHEKPTEPLHRDTQESIECNRQIDDAGKQEQDQ